MNRNFLVLGLLALSLGTAAAEDWRVVAADQSGPSVVMFDGAPNASTNILWRWDPKLDPGVKPKDARAFTNIDECKVIEDGRTIIVNASCEGVAGIDVESGRAKWYSVMHSPCRGAGPHSVAVLPDGCVVVAVSTGGDAVELVDVRKCPLDPSRQERKRLFPLNGAHGVVVDKQRGTVFAIGYTNLVEFAYDSATLSAKVKRTWDYSATAGDPWGHDLLSDGRGGYFFTNHSGVWRFDPDSGNISSVHRLANVKSYAPSADKGDLFAIPMEKWWTDRLLVVAPDGGRRYVGPFPGTRFYKARWYGEREK